MMMTTLNDWLGPQFPVEWVKGALVLGLVSSWVVIALFAYLNHRTRKPYLSLWTVAWMFYSVYLAASFSLQEAADAPLLALARRTCIGISALFLFWGSLQRTSQRRGGLVRRMEIVVPERGHVHQVIIGHSFSARRPKRSRVAESPRRFRVEIKHSDSSYINRLIDRHL